MPGDLSKSLNTVETIPEESPEHNRCHAYEDPFETPESRRRARSEALTQEPQELLSVSGYTKSQSLKRSPPPVVAPSATMSATAGEESCISIVTLDHDTYSNLLENDFDMEDETYEVLDVYGDEEDEGDRSIYFGESEMMCSTNQVTSVSENGIGSGPDEAEETRTSVKFPVSSSAQLQVFYARLEHLILNVPDFPPARTFVE